MLGNERTSGPPAHSMMNTPRPRIQFSVRRLLLAVALVAVGMRLVAYAFQTPTQDAWLPVWSLDGLSVVGGGLCGAAVGLLLGRPLMGAAAGAAAWFGILFVLIAVGR